MSEIMQWKPIESAPKDGTEILVCGGTYAQQYRGGEYAHDGISIASWDSESFHLPDGRRVQGFWIVEDSDGIVGIHNPAHWMPLPELPE